MFIYQKKLQYPVKISRPNPALAKFIISQYGGPDGELGASLRYLSQRYSMPYPELKGLLTDIGTEELAHLEMIACHCPPADAKDVSPEEIKKASGFDAYYRGPHSRHFSRSLQSVEHRGRQLTMQVQGRRQ